MTRTPWVVLAAALAAAAGSADGPKATEHREMCDASAGVPVGADLFAAANDEDNVLRVYRVGQDGGPVARHDLSAFLKTAPENPEADIEGATRVGDRAYWVTSHGQNKNEKDRPNRHRLFATDVTAGGGKVEIKGVGVPYTKLRADMIADPGLKPFGLEAAAKKAPEMGGFNIEGLAATPDGKQLLIGFRSPVPDGKALVVPLENPAAVVAGQEAPKFGGPVLLPLGKRGVRSIEYVAARKAYLVDAGPDGDDGDFALYQWSGNPKDEPVLVKGVDFRPFRPEALVVFPGEKPRFLALSDDGEEPVGKMHCKDVADEKQRRFRSFTITP